MSCTRAQEFLERNKLQVKTTVDARKEAIGRQKALALAAQVDQIYTGRGSKVVHIDLRKEKPDDGALLQALLGPTGNLRAPTIRTGKTLVVGFNEDTYTRLFI